MIKHHLIQHQGHKLQEVDNIFKDLIVKVQIRVFYICMYIHKYIYKYKILKEKKIQVKHQQRIHHHQIKNHVVILKYIKLIC